MLRRLTVAQGLFHKGRFPAFDTLGLLDNVPSFGTNQTVQRQRIPCLPIHSHARAKRNVFCRVVLFYSSFLLKVDLSFFFVKKFIHCSREAGSGSPH